MSWQQNQGLSQHLPTPTQDRFTAPQLIPPQELYVAEFTLNGAGADPEMNTDGTTPKNFRVICPADKMIILTFIEWHYVDAGIEPNTFGGLAMLTNGVVVTVNDSDDSVLWSSPSPIDMNVMWSHLGVTDINLVQGIALDQITVRWAFAETVGYVMYLTEGQYIQTRIQDNLSTLDHFEGTVHGRIIDA
jgi:hypothetical protein